MDYSLRQKLESILNKTVTLSIKHSTTGSARIVDDFRNEINFQGFKEVNNDVVLLFENSIKISIPDTSIVNLGKREIKISYLTPNRQKILIEIYSKSFSNNASLKEKRKSLIKDHYDSEGNLSKIVIDVPSEIISKNELILIKEFLYELLSDWKVISIIKRRTSSPVLVSKNGIFNSVIEVDIPGESFFQIYTDTGKSQKSIDIPPQFLVNIKQGKIVFEFDGLGYEIIKAK